MEIINVTINPKTDNEPRRIIIQHGDEDGNKRVTTNTTAHGNAEVILVWSMFLAACVARVYRYIPWYGLITYAGTLASVAVYRYKNPDWVRKG